MALSFCAIVFIAGCVDTDVNPFPSSIDYSSQLKVVNLVPGAGDAALTLNGQSIGTATFGGDAPATTDFLTIPSGSKTLNASFTTASDQSYQFPATTEYKMRAFIIGADAANSEVVTMAQRYIWQTKDSPNGANLFPDSTGWVAFFNGSPDATISTIEVDGEDSHLSSLAMGDGSPYLELPLANGSDEVVTFDVYYNDDADHITIDVSVSNKGRYTVAVYDSAASIKNAVFVDD